MHTDLALHGLAYLGVLLLFAGVTGLIIFSFGDVSPWMRPLAELLVPLALFVSAWYLRRRNASVVAHALTFLGGAITPIVIAASLTDGSGLPPDLSGHALPVAQGIVVAVVGVVYAVIATRRPSSPLRHLAAPVVWLAAGLAAGVWRDPVPAGYEAARADSLQLAVMMVAVTVTVAVCAWGAVPSSLAETTRRTALPVGAIVVLIELILAGSEGWPLVSTILVGLAAVVLIELSADRLTAAGASIAQIVVVAITAGRLVAVAAPDWIAVGAAVGLLGLVEYHGRRRPTIAGTVVGLAASAVALLVVLPAPGPAAVAFGALTAWGFWRHVDPPGWIPVHDRAGFLAGGAAIVTTTALWRLIDRDAALVATAAAVLALAIVSRSWRPRDLLWRWFVPATAAGVIVVSMALPWGESPIAVTAATVFATAATLLSSLPLAVRTWAASAGVVWALANVAVEIDLDRATQAIVLGAAALVLVVGAVITARPLGVHLATIGHLGGAGAVAAAAWPGWDATAVVTMATAAWLIVTVVDERGEAVHLAALRRALAIGPTTTGDTPPTDGAVRAIEQVPPLITLGGIVASVVLAVDASGWMAASDPWVGVVVSGLAAVAAGVVRVAPWRRARPPVLAGAVIGLVTIAAVRVVVEVGSVRDDWAPLAALALGLVVIVALPPPRLLASIWAGWIASAALALLLADRLGLDRDWIDVAAAAWGAAALIAGLVVLGRRHRPIEHTDVLSSPLLLPPISLGAAALVVGGVLGLSDGSDLEIGWTATGLSLAVLTVALLIPLGALLAVTEALATLALVLLAPWEPIDRPWTFAPWAAVLLAIALTTRRRDSWDFRRWDVPSFLVAHVVALIALALAPAADSIVPTFASFAVVSVAVAGVLRRWPWAAAGAALALVAAFDAGHGWPALVLLVEGVALTATGLLRQTGRRWALLGVGAAALFGAWFELVRWLEWSNQAVFVSTMTGAAIVTLVAAVGLRTRVVPLDLAAVYVVAGSLVTICSTAFVEGVGRRAAGLTIAGALVLLAATAGSLAAVLSARLRWVAAVVASAAPGLVFWALEATHEIAALVGTGLAVIVLTVALAVHGRRPDQVWLLPGAAYGAAVQLVAAAAAVAALPDRSSVVVVLLAASAELVTFGVLTDRAELFLLAPGAACAAWLVYAEDALRGTANWFTVPIGLTVLVTVGLLRWIRTWRGGEPAGYDVVAMELVGMSFLVASPLARTVSGALWNGVLAALIGVLIAAWGAATRVRWRAAFGVGSVVLAVVLLIGMPLSDAVTWRGPMLWIVLSAIGIAAIGVASALEGSRDRLRHLGHRLDEMTEGWERIPIRHRDGGGQRRLPPPSISSGPPGSMRGTAGGGL